MRTSSALSGSQASLLPGANYETAAPAEINGAVVLSWSKSIPCSSRAGAEHPLQPPSQLVLGTASCSPQPSSSGRSGSAGALRNRGWERNLTGGEALLHHPREGRRNGI